MSYAIKLPSYVYLYFFCQSINLMAAVISVSVAASVGNKISPSDFYATVPYGAQFLFLLLGTYPATMVMKRYGRKFGFVAGAIFLLFAGIVGYIAVSEQSFILLILAHGLIGLFTACANYYRYAVTDDLHVSMQSKALSLVVSGGVLAGIAGPAVSSQLQDVASFSQFSLCYAFLTVLALVNLAVIYLLPSPPLRSASFSSSQNRGVAVTNYGTNINILLLAICVIAFGYGLMNLLMLQSSLKLNHMHIPFEDVAFSIQWHVVAMFFPSFFTGMLISRFGHASIIAIGFTLFIVSFLINIQEISYFNITFSLILLGLGWNFSYVGGSSLLTSSLSNNPDRQRWQGIGDTTTAVFATIGAVSPSFLLSGIGWQKSNLIAIAVIFIPLVGLYINRRVMSVS